MSYLLWLRHHKWLLIILIASVIAVLLPIYLMMSDRNPPVGVYVGVMGAIAVLVTFHEKWSPGEKAGWIVVITALMVAEIRNLYVADADQIKRFTAISNSLDATQKGLQKTATDIETGRIASQRQYDATMAQSGRVLELSTRNLKQITGGNAFAYLVPQSPLGNDIPLAIHNGGDSILTGVKFDIMRETDTACDEAAGSYRPVYSEEVGTIDPRGARMVNGRISPHPGKTCHSEDGSEMDIYFLVISAQNGEVIEKIEVRKSEKAKWATRYGVQRNDVRVTPRGQLKVNRHDLIKIGEWKDDF